MSQLRLDQPPVPPQSPHRVRGLAGVLAGFRWPGRSSFEALTKPQKEAALRIARETLEALDREPGDV